MAYSGSKDFYDYRMTQGAAAHDDNAGTMFTGGGQVYTNDGPHRANANCTVVNIGGLRWTIENIANTGWGDTQLLDAVRIDTAGNKELGIVTALAVGADTDIIEVRSALLGGITAGGPGLNCNVGGAFATLNAMTDLLESLSNDDNVGPVRENIKRHGGIPYVQACDIDTNAGTSLRPITIEAYNTIPGDIDPMTSTDRAKFEPDAGAFAAAGNPNAVIEQTQNFYRLLNLDCETAVAGKYGIYVSGDDCSVLNVRCEAPSTGFYATTANRGVFERLLIEVSGSPQFRATGHVRLLRSIIRNGSGDGVGLYTEDTMLDCEIYGNGGDGVVLVAGILKGCTINGNIIADNGGDGIDFGLETDLEANVITNNIIAHNGAWGIANTSGANHRFALIDYNMIYGNTTGAVQDIEAGGDLIDDSEHDNEADAPFTGANAGARAANFYELTKDAKQVLQYFADTNFETYPDAGAAQAKGGGAVQLVGGGLVR